MILSLFLLIAYPAWVRGGTYDPIQAPLIWLGLLALVCLVAVSALSSRDHTVSVRGRMGSLLRDPVTWLGFGFLLLLVVQWLNSGRSMEFSFAEWKWQYGPPPVTGLPSGFDPGETREMLYWFFPAWVALLSVRSSILRRRALRALFALMAVSAGLLSLFGIIQFLSGTDAIYWIQPLPVHFFASFGYPSHAGAYFILMFCVSAGMMCYAIFGHHRRRRGMRAGVFGVCALLCLIGANLSFSLACIGLSWFVAALAALYLLYRLWSRLRPGERISTIAGIVAVALLGAMLITAIAVSSRDLAGEELSDLQKENLVVDTVSKRLFLVQTALRIWSDHPWFGVGGWGYRYLLGIYLKPEEWHLIERGRANVHNDPVQFLAEFGAVGFGLLAAVGVVLAVPIWRKRAWKKPIVPLPLLGTVVILGYSLMDLPFRSPAILYAWVVVFAALPRFVTTENGRE